MKRKGEWNLRCKTIRCSIYGNNNLKSIMCVMAAGGNDFLCRYFR